jgi:hypothetical protein
MVAVGVGGGGGGGACATGVFGGQAVRRATSAVTPIKYSEDLIGPDEVGRGASEDFDAVIRTSPDRTPDGE